MIYFYKQTKTIGLLGLAQLLLVFIFKSGLSSPVGALAPPVALGIANTLVLIISSVIVRQLWKSP